MRRQQLLLVLGFLFLLTPQLVVAQPLPMKSALIAAVTGATADPAPSTAAAPQVSAFSNGDLIALTQPAIVRIITRYEGTTTVPDFRVNLETLTWSIGPGAAEPIHYDSSTSGSGFIVSSDGYIVTNSHVASGAAYQNRLATQLAAAIILDKADTLTAAQNKKLEALGYTKDTFAKLAADGITYIASHLSIITPASITVLTLKAREVATSTSAFDTQVQNSSNAELQKQVANLIKTGVPATVVAENRNFINDEKDIAVIKVNETNLPTIALGDSRVVKNGDAIYVFGFPSTADLNGLTGEPSFTPGAVNAFKDSTQHTFKYIQTDANISHGSSGGPVLNARGEAVGVITLGTSNADGDSFAFAIPIDMVVNVIKGNSITLTTANGYASHITAGLAQKEQKHCKAATDEFTAALGANAVFGSSSRFVQPYIDACAALIASGDSIDSAWDAARAWIKGQGVMFWVLSGGGALLVGILIVLIIFLMRRLHKDEEVMQHMTEGVPAVAASPQTVSSAEMPTMPQRVEEPSAQERQAAAISQLEPTPAFKKNPEITTYIDKARESGQTNEQIRAALLNVGWGEGVVDDNLGS